MKNNSNSASPFWSKFKSVLILILIIGVGTVYFLKVWEIKKLNESHLEYNKAAQDSTNIQLTKKNEDFLLLLVKPMVWAIRTEMLKENFDQINNYTHDFVKNPNVNMMAIIDPSGVVLVCSNKKLEGTSITMLLPEIDTSLQKAKVYKTNNNTLDVVAPIMGFDQQLGSLVITYVSDYLTATEN